MKRIVFSLMVVALLGAGTACNQKVPGSGKVELTNELDSVSYALGFIEAQKFRNAIVQSVFDSLDMKDLARLFEKVDLNDSYYDFRVEQFGAVSKEIFKIAFINELAYEKSYFDEMSANIYLGMAYDNVQKAKLAPPPPPKPTGDIDPFLAENAERSEVIVLESGLQYEILVEGNGDLPSATDRVNLHYHGSFVNGEVFDSSVERGEPITLGVDQVIPGWTEALQLMPVGSKWKLFIPSHLAYGEQGAGDVIGPNETLIFEVELLGIE